MVTDSASLLTARFPWISAADAASMFSEDQATRSFEAHEHLIGEHIGNPSLYFVRKGFACRYVLLPSGQRQILGFVLPGDICDPRTFVFDHMTYSVSALGNVEATLLSRDASIARLAENPKLMRVLWQLMAAESAIDRQWQINLGHRTALERVAHLLCETFTRLHAVNHAEASSCHLPLTQKDLGDALALSLVHVNRTLMELRRVGLISLRQHVLTVHDADGLASVAGFDPSYLLLKKTPTDGAQDLITATVPRRPISGTPLAARPNVS